MTIIRDDILHILNEFTTSNSSELLILYGCRRIGKTFTIKTYYEAYSNFIVITGIYKGAKRDQVTNMKTILDNKFPSKRFLNCKDWLDIFNILKQVSIKQDIIIFFDEISWIESRNSKFLSHLGLFWNTHEGKLKMIICGSDSSFILRNFITTQNEFNFRASYIVQMKPFNLNQTSKYFKILGCSYTKESIFYIYSIVGGIPFYLNQFKKSNTVDLTVENLIFKKNGILSKEFYFLLSSLIENPKKYIDILICLAGNSKGLTFSEIKTRLKTKSNRVLDRLKYLVESEFLIICKPFYNKPKKLVYKINYEFIDFYLKWKNVNSWLDVIDSHKYYTWRGLTFEKIVYKHIETIINILSIKPLSVYIPFYSNNFQIDMLIETRRELVIIECKYTNSNFVIDKDYYRKLVNRIDILENTLKKDVMLIFVSNKKITNNEYSNIVNKNILLNDLFY